MKRVRLCAECGVPKRVSEENRWQDNGAILTFDKDTVRERSAFYEVAGLNELFQNMEESIGKSLFRIIVEARRKDTLGFLEDYLSGLKGVLTRSIGGRAVYGSVASIGAVFGLGRFEIREIRRGERFTVYCENVYSVPLLAGDLIATFNAVERLPATIDIKEAEGGLLCTVSRGEQDETISSRLEPVYVPPKPGSVRFDRCGKCGTPLYMKDVIYDHEKGIITDKHTGRRMTFLSTSNMEAIFREFKLELGDEIVPVILRAKKDYARKTLRREETASEAAVRDFFAIRGLGEVVRYDLREDRLEANVDNAYPYLMVLGILHGMFEVATGREGRLSYEKGDDESLQVSIEAA